MVDCSIAATTSPDRTIVAVAHRAVFETRLQRGLLGRRCGPEKARRYRGPGVWMGRIRRWLYLGLGMLAWRVGKLYLKRRMHRKRGEPAGDPAGTS